MRKPPKTNWEALIISLSLFSLYPLFSLCQVYREGEKIPLYINKEFVSKYVTKHQEPLIFPLSFQCRRQ